MGERQERFGAAGTGELIRFFVGLLLVVVAAGCNSTGPNGSERAPTILRVGAGQIELPVFIENFTLEGLAKVTDDGRLDARLAKGWTVAEDGLSISIQLRAGVKFHDNSLVTARIVADTLEKTLPQFLGAAYEDVSSIEAASDDVVEIRLRRPSSFVLESLESPISKPGGPGIGTGPFISTPANPGEMRANPDYYMGRPTIDRIVVTKYPSVRAAWAELLRDHLDMLYELGLDELESARAASAINVFSFTRRYQYQIIFNTKVPPLRSASIRRALNEGIDREALIRDALDGHGQPAAGPIWPRHWAAQGGLPGFVFNPRASAAVAATVVNGLNFRCLVSVDDERVALVVKRQLEGIGVEMTLEEASIEHLREAFVNHDFDAILVPSISGPTLFRPYRWWHSHGSLNRGTFASTEVDAALDGIRHATSDDDYRAAVGRFQRSILKDPPAIFLAWDERARAVSDRFDVPSEAGVDVLGTLRLWRPTAGAKPGTN